MTRCPVFVGFFSLAIGECITPKLVFQMVHFPRELILSNGIFSLEIHFLGNLLFQTTHFLGNSLFQTVHFLGNQYIPNSTFPRELIVSNTTFSSETIHFKQHIFYMCNHVQFSDS